MNLPHLTQAQAPLTSEIEAVNEHGERQQVSIPAERALTVYVDKRELVTLMTLGANPELLVLGYLRNQRLVKAVNEIESITVDWEVGAAAVKTVRGIEDIEAKTAQRVVTTGCGQGSVFGGLMDEVDQIRLPPEACITQSQLYGLVNTIRLKETTYKSAGSVHACALFSTASGEAEMLLFVEDVGRHNAIDTIAGWMWMNMAPTLPASRGSLPPEGAAAPAVRQSRSCGPDLQGTDAPTLTAPFGSLRAEGDVAEMVAVEVLRPISQAAGLIFYTTGRLTSEMVIKSAQMGVPVVVSRSGITQMGHQVAQAVGLCAIGRATNKRFLCYSHAQRLRLQPELASAVAGAGLPV
ncbi:MAG: formate dehydrogenase, subunit FdhD [Polaromonas sp.]|nr:formate dehydrogenase, subunit FdhD [Polaromonas sp.]